jgi:hypothetical protein
MAANVPIYSIIDYISLLSKTSLLSKIPLTLRLSNGLNVSSLHFLNSIHLQRLYSSLGTRSLSPWTHLHPSLQHIRWWAACGSGFVFGKWNEFFVVVGREDDSSVLLVGFRNTITMERLIKRGCESMSSYYEKVSPDLNEPLYA